MLDCFFTIDKESTEEIIIERSRFIASSFFVETENHATENLALIRKKYVGANHYCYAYILSPNGITRNSDDKEPAKTAGYPILEAIKGNNLYNTMVIVTRYFGGVKLGTGGLARAYKTAALKVITKDNIKKFINSALLEIHTEYNYISVIENTANIYGKITNRNFEKIVKLTAICPANDIEKFKQKINAITQGKAEIKIIEYKYYPFKM